MRNVRYIKIKKNNIFMKIFIITLLSVLIISSCTSTVDEVVAPEVAADSNVVVVDSLAVDSVAIDSVIIDSVK